MAYGLGSLPGSALTGANKIASGAKTVGNAPATAEGLKQMLEGMQDMLYGGVKLQSSFKANSEGSQSIKGAVQNL
ncbi:hypothetical protein [Limnobacter sp.]|jgi:hypothetical protein|uniref:hypothetical protein n=1 Tax=Limnobacter sp. TaxID=2003368 RepID=UPI00311FB262